MKKSIQFVLRTLALVGFAASLATHATQVVQPVKDVAGNPWLSSGRGNAAIWV